MAKPVTLNLIVDKSCNRVIFAESDRHFVDILLSFLTLPLGSILRLTQQSLGSMNNLLESVENLNSECFRSETCRSMLLRPSNTASDIFSSLPIKYDNISNLFSLLYTSSICCKPCLSFYANSHCPHGWSMDKKLEFVADTTSVNTDPFSVFFNGPFKFTISDDLLVSQPSVELAIEHHSKLDVIQRSFLESVSVDITAEQIIELLKRLLVSDTPLTDVFLGYHEEKDNLQAIQQPLRLKCEETEKPTAPTRKISMKLYVDKEQDTAPIAEADSDFVDLLLGFLTYPIGSVISKFGGQSGIRCMDNLFKSVEALKLANCFRSNELIEKLLNPKLPPYFKVKNQLINFNEEIQTQSYFTCSNRDCQNSNKVRNTFYKCWTCGAANYKKELYLTDPKHGLNDCHSTGGYMRISKFMVTDNLVIRQPSSFMVITDILSKTAGKEIHGRNVEIGEHEALALLRASITSENVLSDALLGLERGKRRCKCY